MEGKQTQDQHREDTFQADSANTIQNQERSRETETTTQERLSNSLDSHRISMSEAMNSFNDAAKLKRGAEQNVLQNEDTCNKDRLAYNKRKSIRFQEIMNILKLRTLLHVLSGESESVTACAGPPWKSCTKASQGMCVQKDEKWVCACEPGFYGVACDKRQCPGPGGRLFNHDDEDVCSGTEHGSCDETTGECRCKPNYKHGKGKACEAFNYCPAKVTAGHCTSHGRCD